MAAGDDGLREAAKRLDVLNILEAANRAREKNPAPGVPRDLPDKAERDRAAIANLTLDDLVKAEQALGHHIQPGDIFHIDDVVFKAVAVPDPARIITDSGITARELAENGAKFGRCEPEHVLVFRPTQDEFEMAAMEAGQFEAGLESAADPLQERLERDVERLRAGEFINPYIQMADGDMLRAHIDEVEADLRAWMTAMEKTLYRLDDKIEQKTPRCGMGPGDPVDPWTEIHNSIASLYGQIERLEARVDILQTALHKHGANIEKAILHTPTAGTAAERSLELGIVRPDNTTDARGPS